MLCFNWLIHTLARVNTVYTCVTRAVTSEQGTAITTLIPSSTIHTHTRTHTHACTLSHTHTPRPQTLDWFRLIVPVSCLVLSQSKSLPGYTDNVYIVWLLDRAIVSFTLPPGLFFFPPLSPTSFFSFPSFSLSFSLPFVLPHFLTLLLYPPLLQLFLAGSCMQWLSPPQKQKTLREEWFEYRFVPQSSEFYPFF